MTKTREQMIEAARAFDNDSETSKSITTSPPRINSSIGGQHSAVHIRLWKSRNWSITTQYEMQNN